MSRRDDGLYDLRSRPLVEAQCDSCGSDWYAANAQAVAAQHSRRHGHTVRVSVTLLYTYGSTTPPARRAAPAPQDRLPKGHVQLGLEDLV